MKDVAVALHTSSPDSFLNSRHGIPSAIAMVVDCLERQDYDHSRFQLSFADAYYQQNKELVASLKASFEIIHTPVLHRYWADMGHIDIASAKNSAALHCDSTMVISIDDAEVLPPWFVSKYWDYYERNGVLAHAYHKRCKSIKVENGLPAYPFEAEEYINDSRKFDGNVKFHTHGDTLYAGTSSMLRNLIDLNGHNELSDGQKAQEDAIWGCSLEKAGEKFVIDKNLWVMILEHDPVYMDNRSHFTAIDNFSLIKCVREIDGFNAGNRPDILTPQALQIIREQTIRFRKFDPMAPDRIDNFNKWRDTPSFSFKQEWESIHGRKYDNQ